MMHLQAVETVILDSLIEKRQPPCSKAIFILGSPRTGSTILYQLITAYFGLPYFANLTNDMFGETPIVGLGIQKALWGLSQPVFTSQFGKVTGMFQPSEASLVMRHWFGGEHPSQLKSSRILPGKEEHFLKTLSSAYAMFSKPLVIKNAWNCFRVETIAELVPNGYFIWIRRDIAATAKSDLNARYVVHGSPTAWNSATPANVEELRKRPHWEQVVENQYEFNTAIGKSLDRFAPGRFCEVWYEDLCTNSNMVLDKIGKNNLINSAMDMQRGSLDAIRPSPESWDLPEKELCAIDDYVACNAGRLKAMIREKTDSVSSS